MAIVYPLALPAEVVFTSLEFDPVTVVGSTRSPFTGQVQTFVWPGMWWTARGTLPPLPVAKADPVVAFLLSLNGIQGTFQLSDPSRPLTRGTANAGWAVGAANVADSTTLITQAGAGQFAVGDWLQIGNNLHKVIKVVDATHYDVWPRLRTAYVNGTNIVYANAKGLFRLANNSMKWSLNTIKYYGVTLDFAEAL